MPIYEYHATGKKSCEHCAETFEIMQKLSDKSLKSCPVCHHPVSRKVSLPSPSNSNPTLQQGELEKHGFTQFKKVEKGVYEKTAGKGPRYISDKEDP